MPAAEWDENTQRHCGASGGTHERDTEWSRALLDFGKNPWQQEGDALEETRLGAGDATSLSRSCFHHIVSGPLRSKGCTCCYDLALANPSSLRSHLSLPHHGVCTRWVFAGLYWAWQARSPSHHSVKGFLTYWCRCQLLPFSMTVPLPPAGLAPPPQTSTTSHAERTTHLYAAIILCLSPY